MLFDSFRALGLGIGASEMEVRLKYRTLSQVYHLDVHNPHRTGLTHAKASKKFKLINNAHSYLWSVL